VNEAVGPIRAAAAQADILRAVAWKVPQKMWDEAVLSALGAPQTPKQLQKLQRAWDADVQEAAREILIEMYEPIAMSFKGHDRTRFLEAVEMLQVHEVP
jgi:hypothetical protein